MALSDMCTAFWELTRQSPLPPHWPFQSWGQKLRTPGSDTAWRTVSLNNCSVSSRMDGWISKWMRDSLDKQPKQPFLWAHLAYLSPSGDGCLCCPPGYSWAPNRGNQDPRISTNSQIFNVIQAGSLEVTVFHVTSKWAWPGSWHRSREWLKVRGWKKTAQANSNQEKARKALLTSDIEDFS